MIHNKEQILRNIRRLDTKELMTYEDSYKKGEIYKFAEVEARRELHRRLLKKQEYNSKLNRKPRQNKVDPLQALFGSSYKPQKGGWY